MRIALKRLLVALLFVTALIVPVTVTTPQQAVAATKCAPIHVVGIRGAGEAPQGQKIKDAKASDPKNMGAVVSSTFTQFSSQMRALGKNISGEAILYDAHSVWPPILGPSIREGVRKLKDRLKKQAKACPSQAIVLAGYSQGDWVIQEALLAKGHVGAPLSATVRARIHAVLLYGDPLFHRNDRFAFGSFVGSNRGLLSGAQQLPSWLPAARTYCLQGDPVCDGPRQNIIACLTLNKNSCPHLQYKTSGVTTQAASWLADVFGYSVRIERVYVTDASGKAKTTFKCGQTVQYRVALVNITKVAKPVLLRFSVARVGSYIYQSSGTVNTGPGASTHFPVKTIPKGVSGKYAFVIASTDDSVGTTKATEFTVTC